MFVCPRDHRPLQRQTVPNGFYWTCRLCGGRAVRPGLLRRTISSDVVNRIWTAARETRVARGRPCPSCGDPMYEVSSGPSGSMVDVCRVCRLVWFDTGEFEQMPAAPTAPPGPPTTEQEKERPASAQVRGLRRLLRGDFGTDTSHGWWNYLLAYAGLPVRYEWTALHSIPYLTWAIIAFISAFSIAAFPHLQAAVEEYGLVPALWSRHFGLTFLTAFLLHGSLWHLFGNMYFLYIFGDNVEDFLGKVRYLVLILVAAVIGDALHIVGDSRSTMPLIGASGGISGVLIFYALTFPKTKMGILWRIGLLPIRWIRIPAYAFVGFWILLQFVGVYLQIAGASSISALAHVGGAVTGLAFWVLFRHH